MAALTLPVNTHQENEENIVSGGKYNGMQCQPLKKESMHLHDIVGGKTLSFWMNICLNENIVNYSCCTAVHVHEVL